MRLLTVVNYLVPTVMVAGAIGYREKVHFYTTCIRREEVFHVDFDNLQDGVKMLLNKGPTPSLQVYHPVTVLYGLVGLGYSLVVPLLYFKIYCFRKIHDTEVTGRSVKIIQDF